MDKLFTEKVLEKVRRKQYHHFGNVVDTLGWDMFHFTKLLWSHPKEHIVFLDEFKRIELNQLQLRGSMPDFSKIIYRELKEVFHKHQITNLGFYGPQINSESLRIHADGMDVLYLQVIGEINWSVWKKTDLKHRGNFMPHDEVGEMLDVWHFTPGDLIWIPRGTYHRVEAWGPRLGFSFGVEGSGDPCEYV